MTKAQREKWRARVRERQTYAVEMLDAVMPPISARDVRSWKAWAEAAGNQSEKNGVSDTFFKTGSRLASYIKNNRQVIVEAADRLGVYIGIVPFKGSTRCGKDGLRQESEWWTGVLGGSSRSYNDRTERVREYVELPSVRLALLPASTD